MSNEVSPEVIISVIAGDIFNVKLETQVGSTGFGWALAHMPNSVNLIDISFESSHSHVMGCSETQVFTFVALDMDKDCLKFNLIRAWDPEQIADTKTYTLIIDQRETLAANLLATAGCPRFVSFSDALGVSAPVLKYQPPVVKYMPPIHLMYMPPVHTLYMPPYMGPIKYMAPVLKYSAPPAPEYMAPVDAAGCCKEDTD